MIVIPAIDLREGACVQLVGGSYERERVRLEDPVAIAGHWFDEGFRRLHVVDLDAATGRGSNAGVVEQILATSSASVQVGGGVRTSDQVDALIAAGARHVIVGTRAIDHPEWLREIVARHPRAIIVAADVRGRAIVTRGWQETLTTDVAVFVHQIDALPLAGLLLTAVHLEGAMRGPDLPLVEEIAASTSIPVIASGGVGTVGDLRALAERGAAATVIGMALYTGALDPRAVAAEFGDASPPVFERRA
jgi:phosphoribosylformimino-5-aminoimidazole carboxamide ribotide isomerase